jgi:hypothetical protein
VLKIVIELEDNGRGEFRYEVEGRIIGGKSTPLEESAAKKLHKALRKVAEEFKAELYGKSGTNILEDNETDYTEFFSLN